jgi:competence protein ComFC
VTAEARETLQGGFFYYLIPERSDRVIEMYKRIMDRFSKFISTNTTYCQICNHVMKKRSLISNQLCEPCSLNIPWIQNVFCKICGRYEDCPDCKRREITNFIMNRSAVEYSDEMREWLARYKYRGDESLLPLLVEMLRVPYEVLKRELPKSVDKFDCITYIPLSSERLAERGFNQAEQLALEIGKAYDIMVLPLLKRVIHTGKQSYKTREQRLNDLQHAFTYHSVGQAHSFMDKVGVKPLHILIIDDVYTTGSTLNQCASVIREHLNARIYGLTWAR